MIRLAAVALLAWASANAQNQNAWYENGVVYQIYPKSFQDTKGSGVGDLKGILQHVDYLAELGIDAIWLNPIYPSGGADAGYDISDMTAIDPIYGTMQDFDNLLSALKNRSIGLIMDFVPNHTSNKHPWFNLSVNSDPVYKDYYVWHAPSWIVINGTRTMQPPNNWTSNFDGSMWTFNEKRNQYYLHQFLKEQPDLNYLNPAVVEDMKKVLKFWLDKGIYGFRMDAVYALIENQSWQDEPYIGGPVNAYTSYDHTMTAEQPRTFDILAQFRQLINSHKSNGPPDKIMMTESYNSKYADIQKYYGTQSNPISTFPFNFFWIQNGTLDANATQWAGLINDWYSKVMPGSWAQPNFVLGNHDRPRFASRLTPQHTDVMNMLQLILNGTAIVYFGDEIGLQDAIVRPDQAVDPVSPSRDPERAPMAWSNTDNGGFTNSTPWLPLAGQYWKVNVESQRASNVSHLQVFKDLIKLRKSYNMTLRSCEVLSSGNSLIIYRALNDHPTIAAVINLGNMQETVDLTKSRSSLPPFLQILIKTVNYQVIEKSMNSSLSTVQSNSVTLPPLSGLVLKSF